MLINSAQILMSSSPMSTNLSLMKNLLENAFLPIYIFATFLYSVVDYVHIFINSPSLSTNINIILNEVLAMGYVHPIIRSHCAIL